ncbi:MAG: hypothetical protein PHH77_07575 [Victivallaceae bacterium]|nr:hypothetical protein [Victivallaceae bacterium]
MHTRISLIFHSAAEFKRAVNKGKYFFVDIVKEGIMLYSSERIPLPEIRDLSIKERQYYAQKDFNDWFESANSFLYQFALIHRHFDGSFEPIFAINPRAILCIALRFITKIHLKIRHRHYL